MGIESSFISPTNQTVLNTIDSASKIVSQYSSIKSVAGAGVAGAMESSFIQSGISAITSALSVASALDSFISGATADFGPDSPIRSTVNSLAERNKATDNNQDPETKTQNSADKTNGGKNLSFPETPAQFNITFNFAEYSRQTAFGRTEINPTDTVVLPIPDALYDATSANWKQTELGLSGLALQNLQNYNEVYGEFKDRPIATGVEIGARAFLPTILDKIPSFSEAIRPAAGFIENPALTQIFDGIGFRTHRFRWLFAPKNANESELIRKIIYSFKKHSLPSYSSDLRAFWHYPDIVQPKFSIPEFLYNFKKCIIRDVFVNYNPQATPAFFKAKKAGAPVFIELEISLSEMEYVTSEDYGGSNKALGETLLQDIKTDYENFISAPNT